jgi:hypothetical protein
VRGTRGPRGIVGPCAIVTLVRMTTAVAAAAAAAAAASGVPAAALGAAALGAAALGAATVSAARGVTVSGCVLTSHIIIHIVRTRRPGFVRLHCDDGARRSPVGSEWVSE